MDSALLNNVNSFQHHFLKIKYSQIPNVFHFTFQNPFLVLSLYQFGVWYPCVCVDSTRSSSHQNYHRQTITIYGSSRSLISPLNRSSMFIESVNSIILHNVFTQFIIQKPYLVLIHITRNVLYGKFKSLRLSKLIEFVNSINFTKYLITYYFPNSYHNLGRRRIY